MQVAAAFVLALACVSCGALSVSDDDWDEHDTEVVDGGSLVNELHAEGHDLVPRSSSPGPGQDIVQGNWLNMHKKGNSDK